MLCLSQQTPLSPFFFLSVTWCLPPQPQRSQSPEQTLPGTKYIYIYISPSVLPKYLLKYLSMYKVDSLALHSRLKSQKNSIFSEESLQHYSTKSFVHIFDLHLVDHVGHPGRCSPEYKYGKPFLPFPFPFPSPFLSNRLLSFFSISLPSSPPSFPLKRRRSVNGADGLPVSPPSLLLRLMVGVFVHAVLLESSFLPRRLWSTSAQVLQIRIELDVRSKGQKEIQRCNKTR